MFTLREAGMSYRAIEAATDISKDTAQRMAPPVSDETPEPEDGFKHSAGRYVVLTRFP